MAKKEILHKIKLGEISAVDKPAQVGATAPIIKRDDKKKHRVIGKNVKMTTSVDGHQHIIDMVGYQGEHLYGGTTSWSQSDDEENGHSHPWTINSKGGLVIGETLGHKHEIEDLRKSTKQTSNGDKPMKKSLLSTAALTAGLIAKFDISTASTGDAEQIRKAAIGFDITGLLPTDGPLALTKADKGDDADKKKMKDLEEEVKKLSAIAALSGVNKAHYDTLDDGGKADFLKMSEADKGEAISKAADADGVIYTDMNGSEFRKSDDPRMIDIAKAADVDRKALIKAKADARDARIEKRAAEYDNLPGGEEVMKSVVGAIFDIKDEKIQKGAFDMLKAANGSASADFVPTGTLSKADVTDANTALEKMAQEYATAKNVTYEKAYLEVTKSGKGRDLLKSVRAGAQ